jgi:hypothetical protein
MRPAERHFDATVQGKRECDSNVADAEDDSVVLKPCHVIAGGLPVVYSEGLHDTLGLLLECCEFANTLIFPVEYFRLFVKFSAHASGNNNRDTHMEMIHKVADFSD